MVGKGKDAYIVRHELVIQRTRNFRMLLLFALGRDRNLTARSNTAQLRFEYDLLPRPSDRRIKVPVPSFKHVLQPTAGGARTLPTVALV